MTTNLRGWFRKEMVLQYGHIARKSLESAGLKVFTLNDYHFGGDQTGCTCTVILMDFP